MKFRAQRYPTRYKGDIKKGSETFDCTILSISTGGARIAMDKLPDVGEKVIVDYPGGESAALVKWARNGEIGVAFDRALESYWVDRIRFGLQASIAQSARMVRFTEMR